MRDFLHAPFTPPPGLVPRSECVETQTEVCVLAHELASHDLGSMCLCCAACLCSRMVGFGLPVARVTGQVCSKGTQAGEPFCTPQSHERVYGHKEVAQALDSIAARVAAETRKLCACEFEVALNELRRSKGECDLHEPPVFAVGQKVAIKDSSECRRGNYEAGKGWGEVVKLLVGPIRYVVQLKCHGGQVQDWFHAEELSVLEP